MPVNSEPTTPTDAYKAIIDQLVEETTPGVRERLLRETGKYSKAPADVAANGFVTSLNHQQREVLATMLRNERIDAIHDALAALTWWFLCREVRLTFKGASMPFELSGMGLHGDYTGRLNGWPWPSDGKPE